MTHICVGELGQHCFRQWLVGAKPLSESMLTYCQLDHKGQISMKFYLKFKYFRSRKYVWTCRLRNGGHFVQGTWVKIINCPCRYIVACRVTCLCQKGEYLVNCDRTGWLIRICTDWFHIWASPQNRGRLSMYKDFNHKGKNVRQPSHHCNEHSFTGKSASWYRDRDQTC